MFFNISHLLKQHISRKEFKASSRFQHKKSFSLTLKGSARILMFWTFLFFILSLSLPRSVCSIRRLFDDIIFYVYWGFNPSQLPRIRSRLFWIQKQPQRQLCHNHCHRINLKRMLLPIWTDYEYLFISGNHLNEKVFNNCYNVISVTRKKSPNVYISCLKMISLEKWYTLKPLQKLPKNVGDLNK